MTTTKIFVISLEKMQQAFEQMKNEAGWNTESRLYWGFYFLDHNLQKLEQFSLLLKDHRFDVVEIRNTGEGNLYLLHIEEHKIHSAKSLYDKCNILANYAIENDIEVFDGWDVEKEKINKGLVD